MAISPDGATLITLTGNALAHAGGAISSHSWSPGITRHLSLVTSAQWSLGVTSGWEWHRESKKGRKSRAYSQLPVDRVGFAANSLEGSERACQCASMSVRPIRRSSIRAPPTTPFSSTKEPLGYQGAPSAPSLSTSNEWQFITSGSVSPTWTSSHLGPTEQF